MPGLPDLAVYVERPQQRVQGQVLRGLRLHAPFVLRTAVPPIASAEGQAVVGVERRALIAAGRAGRDRHF